MTIQYEPTGKAKGGIARAQALSSVERKEIAKKAAEARWSVPKATHVGELHIGELAIDCAVLPEGTRVLSQRAVGRALGRGSGAGSKEDAAAQKIPYFLASGNLKSFISNELLVLVTQPHEYRHSKGGGIAYGVAAAALPQICDVWLKAREAGVLSESQKAVAQRAEMLMRGLAHVGIVALVDEATGYQEVRDRLALQEILDTFLNKEFAAWAKRFPDEFYQQMFRLKGWVWKGMKVNRPQVVGKYTKDIVYARLAPGIVGELEKRNPKSEFGNRAAKHHQWLTEDVGHPALAQHLHAVIGLMRASGDWGQFMNMIGRAFPKRGDTLQLPLFDDSDHH